MSKSTMMASLATLAVSATLVGLGTSAAHADDICVPRPGTPDVIGTWHRASFTEWTTDPVTPADPDGQAGEDNLANVTKIGEEYSQTSTDTVQDSGWVTTPPTGSGWELVETKKVSNNDGSLESIPGTPSQWWNFSPNKDEGPLQGEPAFPSDPRGTWQGPHTEGGPSQDLTGTFQLGNGNASWFHREPGTAGQVVEHPPTTHEVYRYERTTLGTTEYRWSVYTRINTEGTDPATCEIDSEEPGTEQPPTEQPPAEQSAAEQAPAEQSPTWQVRTGHEQPNGEVLKGAPTAESAAHRTIPTVINAGL